MIKFEEHEGKLFRMLEKPEPIFTTGDKVTDGVIEGTIIHIEDAIADVCPSTDEYKIELRNLNHIPESPKKDDVEKPKPLLAEAKVGDLVKLRNGSYSQIVEVKDGSVFKYQNPEVIGSVALFWCDENGDTSRWGKVKDFDIIFTEPLAPEGSAEWALQMMKLGKCVCHVKAPSIKYHRPTHYIKRVVRENCTDDMSDAVWMEGADPTGWQIYHEPKPEPIFATGDKVTDGVIEGTIIHIEDAIASVCPSTDEYMIELRNLNHIPESPKQDDVEKPLRSMIAEAKAIGKNIRTYYQDIVFTPQALEACLNQGKFRWWNICNWELTTREQNYYPSISTSSDGPKEEPQPAKEPIANCENCKHVCTNSNVDHCHMYEPKPKSENIIHGYIPADMRLKYIHLFKVGDWVEHKESKEQATIRRIMSYGAIEIEFAYSTESDIYQANDFHNDFRKLSPSEVIVKIGCLSGTVRINGEDCEHFLLKHSPGRASTIRFDALDTETRDLVESLLEAQEEEK
jgi:hypothetical protein